jgi:hypothetical protein
LGSASIVGGEAGEVGDGIKRATGEGCEALTAIASDVFDALDRGQGAAIEDGDGVSGRAADRRSGYRR